MMNGLELCEHFYWDIVAPLIIGEVPTLKARHAAGLIGYGSDVLGFDDELSRDHEWGPRGQIWLSPRDYTRYATRLDRLFDEKLPEEYQGFSTRFIVNEDIQCLVPAPTGQRGQHHLAISTPQRHLRIQLGIRKLPLHPIDWLCMPEQKLLEFTRGRIFSDPSGEITRLRQVLSYFPEPVWRMKLLYAWESADELLDVVLLNQRRGDEMVGRINLGRMVERILRITFLINRRYCPGSPKWMEREFNILPCLADQISPLIYKSMQSADLLSFGPISEQIFSLLVEAHNQLGVTRLVALQAPRFGRGLIGFDLHDVTSALRDTLPPELEALDIHGGIDQWVNNPDILIWAEQYNRFKSVYSRKSQISRVGIGDMLI